ncbi:MAG: serine--tRNA ligase [Candidatus Neomarinimicrobiota bacterium]|mgnify:FL=1|jgi:seryl-tRNA synthetase|nr:serine--tRNA ligase [Candidatus Neomarinimicrobiota bacterium]GIS42133.1 MAG: serine--tRNA ligase [Candidatus Neomarinimicrobiota bacterium]|tara:strand:- start:2910 stop:4175 length:1266 start_codon:yes stop_codon:yes gene_type:complete
MIAIKKIRDNQSLVEEGISKKGESIDLSAIVKFDSELRDLTKKLNDLQSEQNKKSKEIGKLKSENLEDKSVFTALKKLSNEVKDLENAHRIKSEEFRNMLLEIPNLPHDSVPIGKNSDQNVIYKDCSSKKEFSFEPKSHVDLVKKLDLIDFEAGAKISGSGFPLYKGNGALLERALINFMLDYNLKNYNYTEIFPPFLVRPDSATTTGQLPKFNEDMYYIEKDDLYLIPTAEVPLTNIHKDEILNLEDLPKYYLAYSGCFRREAGSYGKDTRGLLRVHQFNKVELVKFVHPNDSYTELETLTEQASKILDMLELDYRIIELCSGDLSFAASKCYDLEVWAPGEKQWLEVSSCSNFEDFQSRRGNIKFRDEDNKTNYVHTLNGSGLATPRVLAALIETHQKEDGSISIPSSLQPYTGLAEIK